MVTRRVLAFRVNYVGIILYGLILFSLGVLTLVTGSEEIPRALATATSIFLLLLGCWFVANGVCGLVVTVKDPSLLPERTNTRWPSQGFELLIGLRRQDTPAAAETAGPPEERANEHEVASSPEFLRRRWVRRYMATAAVFTVLMAPLVPLVVWSSPIVGFLVWMPLFVIIDASLLLTALYAHRHPKRLPEWYPKYADWVGAIVRGIRWSLSDWRHRDGDRGSDSPPESSAGARN